MKILASMLCCFLATAVPALAEEGPLPFSMPIPEGWRTETIPFPLGFAPELPYTGLEELRFAPGMFEEGSEDFWTYAFVWWVDAGEPNDVETMAGFLDDYFRGLAHAVAESRGFEVGEATFTSALEARAGGGFSGTAQTYDAFTTRAPLELNIVGEVIPCSTLGRQAIFFGLSPQETDHPVWRVVDSIREEFRCLRPVASAESAR